MPAAQFHFRPAAWEYGWLMMAWLLLAAGAAVATAAGEGRCEHCHRDCGCQKVCRLICEEKKITTCCWGCKDEDFCVPGPSKPGCRHEEWVCEDVADASVPCVQPKKFVWWDWIPSCHTQVFTRHKLMKKTVTTTVPQYKWVVEDLCAECASAAQAPAVPK